MNIFQPVKDYFDMQLEDQGSFVTIAKKIWDKCPMWVRSLVVAVKLTLITVGTILVITAIFGAGTLTLVGVLGLWWFIHRLMQKGILKTLGQLWAVLVAKESADTVKVNVVETPSDGEQDAGFHKKAEAK